TWPAWWTRGCGRRKAWVVMVNSWRPEAGSPPSAVPTSIRPPEARPSSAHASSGSRRRPDMATDQPSRARASAAALPIPVPPPVTMATFSPERMDRPPQVRELRRTSVGRPPRSRTLHDETAPYTAVAHSRTPLPSPEQATISCLATFHKGERLFRFWRSEGLIVILESHEPVQDH